MLHLYKFREKEKLREEGRIEVNNIITLAKSALISAHDDDDLKKSFFEIHNLFIRLEHSQHHRDTLLRGDNASNTENKMNQPPIPFA